MCTDSPLTAALHEKIAEQIERTEHLIRLVPADSMEWVPSIRDPWTVADLLGHLVQCVLGFCAVLYAAEPQRLAHLQGLREPCPIASPAAAIERLRAISAHIAEGFQLLGDASLSRRLPTIFEEQGEILLTLFLGNLEHVINHKHQLFTYLRWMGIDVGSPDLYRFRS